MTAFRGLRVAMLLLALAVPAAGSLAAQAAAPTSTTTATTAVAGELDAAFEADERSFLGEDEGGSLAQSFVEMVLVLGFVSLLAYLLLGKLLPRVMQMPMASQRQRILTVIDRLPVDARASLMVVKMGEQHFLVGHSEKGLSLLTRLDASEVRDALTAAEAERLETSPLSGMSQLFGRRKEPSP